MGLPTHRTMNQERESNNTCKTQWCTGTSHTAIHVPLSPLKGPTSLSWMIQSPPNQVYILSPFFSLYNYPTAPCWATSLPEARSFHCWSHYSAVAWDKPFQTIFLIWEHEHVTSLYRHYALQWSFTSLPTVCHNDTALQQLMQSTALHILTPEWDLQH